MVFNSNVRNTWGYNKKYKLNMREYILLKAVAWQNRRALDWLLAEKGGVCAHIGEMCCTFIPNNTAPDGSFTLAMNNLKHLRKELKENAGHDQGMFGWLETKFGMWGMMFAKIGAILLIVLTVMGLIFCCCIPIVRSVIASRLSKEIALMVTGIEESVDWERMLYGEIDWSETGEETGM